MDVLYQLSYLGNSLKHTLFKEEIKCPRRMGRFFAGTTGLEPATSRVTGGCSNQLSYVPMNGMRGQILSENR